MTDASGLSDDRLEMVLRSVGQHLVVEAADDSGWRPQPRRTDLHSTSPSRAWLVAAAILVLVLSAVVVSPVRRTLAGWFSIGQTDVTLVGSVDRGELPELQDGALAITADDAVRRLGRPLPDAAGTRLGLAEASLAPPEGGVLLLWPTGSTTLWIRPERLEGDVMYDKLVDTGADVSPVVDLGDGALSITGDHVLRTPQRLLAADTVVLWTADGLEYRLESDLSVDEMVTIARALAR